jgi:ribonucleotide reductase alpha subunit
LKDNEVKKSEVLPNVLATNHLQKLLTIKQDQDTSKGKAENHAEAWTNDETTQIAPTESTYYPTRSSQQFIVGTRKVWGKNSYVN